MTLFYRGRVPKCCASENLFILPIGNDCNVKQMYNAQRKAGGRGSINYLEDDDADAEGVIGI